MKDALATHRRLVAAGLSENQAKTLLRLIVDAEVGNFDRRAAEGMIASADFSAAQTSVLVSELLERLARKSGSTP